jgi:zinc transport system substrate-binding protein
VAWAIAAILVLSASLTGCSQGSAAAGDNGKPNVVASIFAPYDFARQVCGDAANVSMLVPPGAETHSFEPTPQDILKLQQADVFIYVGGESDAWIEDVLTSLSNPGLELIKLTSVVQTVDEETVEGMMAEEEAHEHEEAATQDEHVWTAPKNAIAIVNEIALVMGRLDAANAATYTANAAAYNERLQQLDDHFARIVANGERSTIIFGDRFPFRYFADEYGLTYFAAFPGCSTATEANAQTISFLVDKVRAEKIPVVFYIELSSHRIATAIAEETGAQELLFHACHNISAQDFEAGETYLSLMQKNAANLEAALS